MDRPRLGNDSRTSESAPGSSTIPDPLEIAHTSGIFRVVGKTRRRHLVFPDD